MDDCVQTSSDGTGMPSFNMSSPFNYHCLADGQLTPPSSPDLSRIPRGRHGPRLQLARVLKRPRSARDNRTGSLHQTQTAPIRPSVSRMRAPFSLLLPRTPPNTDCSSVSTPSPTPPPELRSIGASYHDLRSAAAQQSQEKASPVSTPLLPSPMIHNEAERFTSCFRFRDPQLGRSDGQYKSYEDLHILSCYYDNQKLQSMEQTSIHQENAKDSDSSIVNDADGESTASEDMPETPKDRPHRDTTCSTESDWLANTTSHTERLRRFKARCYQVVQHPMNGFALEEDNDGIMLATVLVGPGKPKLIQVSRPPSGSSRRDSRAEGLALRRPVTPKHQATEVSAFSPYDTPCDMPDSHNPSTDDDHCSASDEDPSFSSAGLVPDPLTLSSAKSAHSSSTGFSSTMHQLQQLADPFGWSPHFDAPFSCCRTFSTRRTSAATSWTLHNNTAPRDHYQSPVRSPPASASPTMTFTNNRKLSRTLNAVTQTINNFPDGILRLDSACVLELRCPHVADDTYITTLGKIFPHANSLLLSALAAWLLVDLYLASLSPLPLSVERSREKDEGDDHWYLAAATSNESLHRIPLKARHMLGIGLPDLVSVRLNGYALRKRAEVVRQSVRGIGQKLMEALRGSAGGGWDEDLWKSLTVLVEVIEGAACGWV